MPAAQPHHHSNQHRARSWIGAGAHVRRPSCSSGVCVRVCVRVCGCGFGHGRVCVGVCAKGRAWVRLWLWSWVLLRMCVCARTGAGTGGPFSPATAALDGRLATPYPCCVRKMTQSRQSLPPPLPQYHGSRDPWLLNHLDSVSQTCCGDSCCYHETCVHWDDDDGHRRLEEGQAGGEAGGPEAEETGVVGSGAEEAGAGDGVTTSAAGGPGGGGGQTTTTVGEAEEEEEEELPCWPPQPLDAYPQLPVIDGVVQAPDEEEGASGAVAVGDGEEFNSTDLALLGGHHTECHCDTWGTSQYWFSCSPCYQGLAEITYERAETGEIVDATVKSGDHPGKVRGCLNSTDEWKEALAEGCVVGPN